jgi:hypothetical protein
MSDDLIDSGALDVATLSDDHVAALGDSALGHAVRRMLALGDASRGPAAVDPIAAHDSHV